MFRPKSLLIAVVLLSLLLIAPLYHASAQEPKTPSGQAQPSNQTVWQQWLGWLPTAPPVGNPGTLIDLYRSRLLSAGASAAEADRQTDIIRRTMRESSDGWRVMFNNIYASSTPGFVTEPNALLVTRVEGRKPGRALDIGMGQGRNALFLALKGWEVTGFDISDEGIAVARKNAERAGVKLNAVRAADETFDYGSDQWDLIALIYEPFPVTSATYVERLRKSMKPGGLIVIESYGAEASMPNRPGSAIDPGQLLAAFKDFRLLHFEDTVAKPDWLGPDKKEKTTRIVRMVAEKRP